VSTQTDHVTFFRTQRLARYVDTCTGRRLTTRGTINATTYQYDSEAETVVYDDGGGSPGVCLLRRAGASADPSDFGQQSITLLDFFLYLPDTATGIQPDDRFTMDTSVADPELVGKLFIVRGVVVDSYRTATKLAVELNVGPGEAI
jgi:hypothetical protein